ncbi:zinc-binding dehydrogenase [Dactylosporangium sp. NPDC005572]|uniref:zinc-binding dehydrogenase n=1 Tax=Dactylosporangium sp. NPDC005572 TaxID=3156889 RepID=UPI0033AD065C
MELLPAVGSIGSVEVEQCVEVASLPLDRAAEAHRRIESGGTTGKLVLDVAT